MKNVISTYQFDKLDEKPVGLGGGEKLEEARDGHQEQTRIHTRELVDGRHCTDLDTGLGVLKAV